MGRPRLLATVALLTLLGCLGCPHDFTRPARQERGDLLAVDHSSSDLRPAPDELRPPDLHSWPDGPCSPCVVTLNAGRGAQDGPLADARFLSPVSLRLEPGGSVLVVDEESHQVRRIAGGQVTTVAGSGTHGYLDGPVATARFNGPRCADSDAQGKVAVADSTNQRLRLIAGGQVSHLAGIAFAVFLDGPVQSAGFAFPASVLYLPSGALLVADRMNDRIRSVSGGQVTTLAGSGEKGLLDGPLLQASFSYPSDLALGLDGTIYVCDMWNSRIRSIANGVVKTVAGTDSGFADGPALEARFNQPDGIAIDAAGALLVADSLNHRIRRVANGQVTTLAGSGVAGFRDGPALQARFYWPSDVLVDASGAVLVADRGNSRIRQIR